MKFLNRIIVVVLLISISLYIPILIYFLNSGVFLFSRYSGLLLINIIFGLSVFFLNSLFKGKKSRRDIQKKMILLLFSLYFSIMFIEIILRIISGISDIDEEKTGNYLSHNTKKPFPNEIANPLSEERYFVHKNNSAHFSKGEFCYYRKTNSLNLSEKEIQFRKPDGEIRIIGLGDSYTEGFGADYDSSWLKHLEYDLNRGKILKNINTINAGVAGSDPVFEFVLFKEKLLNLMPDYVIYDINATDVSDIIIRNGFNRYDKNGKFQKKQTTIWWECFYASSYLLRLFLHNVLYYDYYSLKRLAGKSKFESLETIKEVIIMTEKLAQDNNFKLIVVFQPLPSEIIEKRYYSNFAYLINYLNMNYPQVITVDLLDFFVNECGINKKNINNYFWGKDKHANSKGYNLFAKGIEIKLKETGILDSLKKE
jgi:hypothetical protein